MKKIAFGLYIGCVLAFSAFARAEVRMPFFMASAEEASNVQIESVAVDPVNLDLMLTGYLPDPCHSTPTAFLVQDTKNPATLILKLSSFVRSEMCITRVEDYSTVVNLPVVAQNSRLTLDDKAVYMIKAEGHEFELEVMGSDLMRVPGFVGF